MPVERCGFAVYTLCRTNPPPPRQDVFLGIRYTIQYFVIIVFLSVCGFEAAYPWVSGVQAAFWGFRRHSGCLKTPIPTLRAAVQRPAASPTRFRHAAAFQFAPAVFGDTCPNVGRVEIEFGQAEPLRFNQAFHQMPAQPRPRDSSA